MVTPNSISDLAPAAVELFTWFWDKYGNTLTKNAAQTAWRHFDHALSARRYAQKIGKLYGNMRILGKSDPVAVSDIYTDLSILGTSTSQLRYDPNRLNMELWERKSSQEKINRVDGMEAIGKINHLLILGRPGAGKSTFLRHVALEALKGIVFSKYDVVKKEKVKGTSKVEEKRSVKLVRFLPLLIELRDYALEETTLFDYMAKQFDVCDFPNAKRFLKEVLKDGRLIILFDGLDEVPKEQDKMRNINKEIEDFTKKYNKNKFIMTCRISATDYKFSQFTYVELAEFSSAQATTFTKKWFQHKPRLRTSFWRDLDESGNVGLLEITRNPLLLTLLCLNYEATQNFPQRRVEIYEEALDALLKTWDAERGIIRTGTKISSYGKLSLGYKKEMFSELAVSGFNTGRLVWKDNELADWLAQYVATIPPQQDARNVDGLQILKDIEAQHAILIESAKNQYSFAHLTFQEYYTANYFVTAGIPSYKKLIKSHLDNKRWREIFLLASSKMSMPHADEFFKLFLEHLRNYKSKNDVTRQWIGWVNKRTKGAQKNGVEALMIRNFLALCSANFNRQPIQSGLDYFCKLYGINKMDSYHDLLFKSLFGQRVRELNFNMAFECILFSIYKLAMEGEQFQSDDQDFMRYYKLISSIAEKISKSSSLHGKENVNITKDIFHISNEGRFSALGLRIEQFLKDQRGWEPAWGQTSGNFDYLDTTMLCIECLDISRVSNRSKIYSELFA
jgi:adenylate kinase family enzyme